MLFDNSGSGGSGAAPFAAEVMATEANSGGSGGAEEKGRGEGGNMWSSEETVALLNVRSKMDGEFRETALKPPLWDEVSRKLNELGYTRSGKKCRENLSSSPSDQNQHEKANRVEPTVDQIDSASYGFIVSTSTTSSGKDSEENDTRGWKMADYFEKLMNKVVERQETLQKQVLDTLERCEKDRIAQEEAWRNQYLEKLKNIHELRAKERAKDVALIELLQKVTNNNEHFQDTSFIDTLTCLVANIDHHNSENNSPEKQEGGTYNIQMNGVDESCNRLSSTSRWPKEEVETLIKIRTQDGLKCPVWDEVSSAMKKFGYDREAKRCREKWDNINKYYRRVKESHKRKPGSSKTCPYFNLLDSIYKKKSANTPD